LDGQIEIPIIQADKQWAIKCQQFPDRSTSIFGAPGAVSIWYEGSIHQKASSPRDYIIHSTRKQHKIQFDSLHMGKRQSSPLAMILESM